MYSTDWTTLFADDKEDEMGKEIKVTCDGCGVDIYGQKYFTLNVRKVMHGKQTMNPAIYLCPKCFRETKLALMLCDMEEN